MFCLLASLAGCLNASLKSKNAGQNDGTQDSSKNSEASGWTELKPSPDSVVIYVSSSSPEADDRNDGRSPQRPLKTLAAAKAKLRRGFPDWLMLKEGDSWNESLSFDYSGRNVDEPQVITSYCDKSDSNSTCGTRPQVVADIGLRFEEKNSSGPVHDVAVVGIHFKPATYIGDPSSFGDPGPTGVLVFYRPGDNILIEDCLIEKYKRGIFVYQPSDNNPAKQVRHLRIRRNIIVDSFVEAEKNPDGSYEVYGWNAQRKSNGISLTGTREALIEENLLDHNGYNENDPAALKMGHNSTIARRGIDYGGDFVVRGNLILRGGQEGVNMENGGTADDNLFYEIPNPITSGVAMQNKYDPNGDPQKYIYKAILNRVTNNVVLSSTRSDAWANGGGISLSKPTSDSKVTGNIVARIKTQNGGSWGLSCEDPIDADATSRNANDGDCTRIPFEDNLVASWPKGISIRDMVIEEPLALSMLRNPQVGFESYMAAVGESGGFEAFVLKARLRARAKWDSRLTAHSINEHLRAGLRKIP